MTTTVRYFAAAKAAMGTGSETVDASVVRDIEALIRDASSRVPAAAAVLARCSFLVDGKATTDPATSIPPEGSVDVLPPFAGG